MQVTLFFQPPLPSAEMPLRCVDATAGFTSSLPLVAVPNGNTGATADASPRTDIEQYGTRACSLLGNSLAVNVRPYHDQTALSALSAAGEMTIRLPYDPSLRSEQGDGVTDRLTVCPQTLNPKP